MALELFSMIVEPPASPNTFLGQSLGEAMRSLVLAVKCSRQGGSSFLIDSSLMEDSPTLSFFWLRTETTHSIIFGKKKKGKSSLNQKKTGK